MQHLDFQLYINILNCGIFNYFNYDQTRIKSHISFVFFFFSLYTLQQAFC